MHDPNNASFAPPIHNRALTLWLTGISGAGKSTLARAVCDTLTQRGVATDLLDSDLLRPLISPDLRFSPTDRIEHARRLAACARAATSRGVIAVVCAVSPSLASRAETRVSLQPFIEIFVDAPVAVCERRDPVGLYRRFRNHEIRDLAGLDAPYETPRLSEVHCQTHLETIEESTQKVVAAVMTRRVPQEVNATPRPAGPGLLC